MGIYNAVRIETASLRSVNLKAIEISNSKAKVLSNTVADQTRGHRYEQRSYLSNVLGKIPPN